MISARDALVRVEGLLLRCGRLTDRENQLRVYGGLSMSNTVLTTLGLTNVFADVNKRVTEVSTEEPLGRNPGVILLTYGGSETSITNGADAERALRGMTPLD